VGTPATYCFSRITTSHSIEAQFDASSGIFASIIATPNPVSLNTALAFDISASTQQDSNRFLTSWKIDLDALDGLNWSSPNLWGHFPASSIVMPGYAVPGDYVVTLQVTDNASATEVATVTVRVVNTNVPPVASPGGPYFASLGATVNLDGSSSYDPDTGDYITRYEWDVNNDGLFEIDTTLSTYPCVWNEPYSGIIALRVTDNWGNMSLTRAQTNVTISDLKPVSYPLVSSRRITRTLWEYTYRFIIRNNGYAGVTNTSAQLTTWPGQVTVIDGAVSFGAVPAGVQMTSSDTFTIRVDQTTPMSNADLTWRLDYTDGGGVQRVLMKLPLK
jgi:hypothetical protein